MSALRSSVVAYVAIRRALGARFTEPATALGHFVDFLESEGAQFVTTALALRWAKQPSWALPSSWARRLGIVRGFAAWQSAYEPRTEVPPERLIRARHRRKTPYIFTDQAIEQIMGAAAQLSSPTKLRSLTYVTLIGLLATTGMRPGEALALDVADVDLETGILTVRQTKFGKTRVVPVGESARTALACYAKRRDKIYQRRRSDAFLVDARGARLGSGTVRRTFAKLCRATGLRKPQEGKRIGRGPRLYDLRHTFATQRMVEWYRAGLDVGRKMPGLSTYLGHLDVAHTYWYVEAIPELLQLATERLMTDRQGGGQ